MIEILSAIGILMALGALALSVYCVDQWVQKRRGVATFKGDIPSGPIWKFAQVLGVIVFIYIAAKYGGDYDQEWHRP